MSQLFSPVSLGKLELPNRILLQCQYSAEDGKATAWHTMHLGNLSHSGAGLLITLRQRHFQAIAVNMIRGSSY
ncbi:hypothetical protein KP22_07300 [Pectobacterium betavasculorum]|uniref:Uncharacterized protein n=1 Tax=Pectobacterium betavasculorum TaxID=55207 RepID=A0A093RXG9_9GAMM|nr:hypothetical protein KP22_07300 [Pectobacterium betavasculorum]KFX21852.1 hypothetical protein JV35_01480 [Pectobacterium betavasculorum]